MGKIKAVGKMDFTFQRLQILLVAVALFLGGYLVHSFIATGAKSNVGDSPRPALSMNEMATKTLDYIAEKFLEPQGIEGKLLGVGRYGNDLYQVNLSFQRGGLEQNASVWVTRDGKLILLGDGGIIVDIMGEPDKERKEKTQQGISSTEADPYKGNVNAPIIIVEFSDYQCPFCQRFWQDTLPKIQSEYIEKGLVKLVFRDFPLTSIHPYAQKAAEAAQCAFEQGKFWEYHDRLFSDFRSWQREGNDEFKKIAKDLGLDGARFGDCIDSGKYAAEVQRDLQDGIKAGVTGTPAFYVNGVKLEGALPFSAFQEVIESQLSKLSTEVSTPDETPSPSTSTIAMDVSDAAYAFGPLDAPITMIEFNDYQCPFCKRFRDETFDSLLQLYGGKIRYVFMDFPITTIHPQALITHVAARCAGDQGKYLEYHDKLFANQQVWSRNAPESKEEIDELKKYAKEIGLNSAVFDQCLDSKQYASEVISNLQKGVNAGVTGTPTFFINGQKITGALPLSAFQEVIAVHAK